MFRVQSNYISDLARTPRGREILEFVKEAFSKQALLTPAAEPDRVFTWRVPDLKLSVQIQHDLIERLHQELLLNSSGENLNGLQGVLVGRHLGGPERAIIIDDYELAPERHEDGLFRSEAETILALADRWPTDREDRYALGLFRSARASQLILTRQDLGVARHLSSSQNVVLLLSSRKGKSHGVLFLWEGEADLEQVFQLDLPFETIVRSIAPKASTESGQLRRLAQLNRSGVPRRHAFLKFFLWGVVTLAVLTCAVAAWFVSQPRKEERPRNVESRKLRNFLNLRTQMEGGVLSLIWNGSVAAAGGAEDGSLNIVDGGVSKDIHLSKNQLRAGHLYFAPLTLDVSVRLAVRGMDGREISETVVALGKVGPVSQGLNDAR